MPTLNLDRNPSMDKKAFVLEVVGTIFIIFLGSALHFTYAASGNNPVVGAFSAVNESVWEHLKLAFWPALVWMLIVLFPIRRLVNNFFFAKTVGAYVMVTVIPLIFYVYTVFTGESILAIDIGSFFAAVIVGQLVSYAIYRYKRLPRATEKLSIVAFVLLAIIFVIFTFYPPHLPIFQDSVTGQYGA